MNIILIPARGDLRQQGCFALEIINSDPDQFDLLITDQTMPHLTGVELALATKELNANLPIILCTGHSDLIPREKAIELGIKKYIPKPIIGNELLLAIRSTLDEVQSL